MATPKEIVERVQAKAEFNAVKAQAKQGIPRFVTVETGEYELDADGKLVLDDEGDPTPLTKTLIVQRTGKALMDVLAMAPDDDETVLPQEGEEASVAGITAKEAVDGAKESVEFTYQALARFLCDPQDGMKPVDPEWLSGVLDFSVASDWLEVLMPSRGEEGNFATAPSSEEAPSETS